jgi:hypothetical protein
MVLARAGIRDAVRNSGWMDRTSASRSAPPRWFKVRRRAVYEMQIGETVERRQLEPTLPAFAVFQPMKLLPLLDGRAKLSNIETEDATLAIYLRSRRGTTQAATTMDGVTLPIGLIRQHLYLAKSGTRSMVRSQGTAP